MQNQNWDSYLNNQLSEQEDNQMTTALLKAVTNRDEDRAFAERLEQLRAADETKPVSLRVVARWSMAAAATFLLALGLWRSYTVTVDTPQYNSLIAAYLQATPEMESTKLGDPTPESLWQEAKTHYKNGQLAESALVIEQIKPKDREAKQYFYLGICHLKQQKPDFAAAIIALSEANKRDNGYLKSDINWYLALAFVGNEQKQAALPLLHLIQQNGKEHADNAEKLLKDLEQK